MPKLMNAGDKKLSSRFLE